MSWLDYASIVLVLVLVVLTWMRRRSAFLYPSTWILLLSTLLYLLPALVFSQELAELSPFALTAVRYCAVFTFVGLTFQYLRRPPDVDAALVAPRSGDTSKTLVHALWAVLSVLGLLTTWYLSQVPLRSTGLYGVLFDPENSVQLREESLKLLASVALHYAYLVGFSLLCPLAFALMLARAAEIRGLRRAILVLLVSTLLAFYLLLSGARVGLVYLAVVGAVYAFLRSEMRLRAKAFTLAVGILFAVPMLISFLREQGRNDAASIFGYFDAVGRRIFLLPLLISGWFVEYADNSGYLGLSAALGLERSVDWSNVIALEFLGRVDAITFQSVTTPTAYFFNNYLYFGWFGVIPSWLALYVIDFPVRWAIAGPVNLRAPLLATMIFFAVLYVQTSFGVAMVSDGYALLTLIVWFLAWWRAISCSGHSAEQLRIAAS